MKALASSYMDSTCRLFPRVWMVDYDGGAISVQKGDGMAVIPNLKTLSQGSLKFTRTGSRFEEEDRREESRHNINPTRSLIH